MEPFSCLHDNTQLDQSLFFPWQCLLPYLSSTRRKRCIWMQFAWAASKDGTVVSAVEDVRENGTAPISSLERCIAMTSLQHPPVVRSGDNVAPVAEVSNLLGCPISATSVSPSPVPSVESRIIILSNPWETSSFPVDVVHLLPLLLSVVSRKERKSPRKESPRGIIWVSKRVSKDIQSISLEIWICEKAPFLYYYFTSRWELIIINNEWLYIFYLLYNLTHITPHLNMLLITHIPHYHLMIDQWVARDENRTTFCLCALCVFFSFFSCNQISSPYPAHLSMFLA